MQDSITIQEAKSRGLIPDFLADEILDNCPTDSGGCGQPIHTTLNLKTQFCINPRCPFKLAGMAVKTLRNFGVIGIGAGFCRKFFQANPKYISHLALFVCSKEELYSTNELALSELLLSAREKILNERFTFAEIVSKFSLPNFNSSALEIFNLFESYQIFQKFLEIKEMTVVDYIMQFEGYQYTRANNIANTIKEFEIELKYIPRVFKIRPYGKTKYTIAMTGTPGFYNMTKSDFLKYLNRIGRDIIHIESTGSALMSCDYIVCSSANEYLYDDDGNCLKDPDGSPIITQGTNKKNIGIMRNKQEMRKVLVTAEEMRDIVLDSLRKYKGV